MTYTPPTRSFWPRVFTGNINAAADFGFVGAVPASTPETVRASYTIPANQVGILRNYFVQLNSSGIPALSLYVYLDITRPAVPQTRLDLQYNTSAVLAKSIVYELPLPAGTLIRIVTANGGTVGASVRFEITLDLVWL